MSKQNNIENNKRIAKNTVFLYIRMFITMGVSLFSSRVVLDKLGVDDYALYNVVGGVVGMLSFLSGTLNMGTVRFLTYELGTGNKERLIQTFCTSFYAHFALAIIIVLLLETFGLWFLYNKLVIQEERLTACFWVLQISIITTIINITQTPYSASILSYEKMSIFAYVSIFEAVGKLIVCYLLSIVPFDRLVLYACLIAIVQILVAIYYRLYCVKMFDTCQLSLCFNKNIFKKIMTFSGWNILANLTETLKSQGVVIIINLFLSPVVVASQALANQVSAAMMQFVNSFRTAINPQIIKLYAAGDKDGSKKMMLESTVYCFDLILLLALPCIYTMNTLMSIWLVDVPEYAVIFTQIIIGCQVIGTFNASFYIPMMAANRVKKNSLAAIVLGVGQFIILYFILKYGGGPMCVPWLNIFIFGGFSLIVKPYILWKDIDYSLKELSLCYLVCLKVLVFSFLLSFPLVIVMGDDFFDTIVIIVGTMFSVCIASIFFMENNTRKKFFLFVKSRLSIL